MSSLKSIYACLDCSFGNDHFIIVIAIIITADCPVRRLTLSELPRTLYCNALHDYSKTEVTATRLSFALTESSHPKIN